MSELSYQLRKEVKEYNTGFFKGDLNKIRELIKRGANVNDIDEYDRTALHIACYDDKHVPDFDLIETLIRCGGRVDLVNRYGENCLHLICQNHYKDELCKLLLDCGADPNHKDFHGNTPLHVLVENPKQDVSFGTLRLFVRKGADVYALNKLNKNVFVYLEPQMNEDLQFYAKKCLVKLNRLKRLLGMQQQQIPTYQPMQNIPIESDLPSRSEVPIQQESGLPPLPPRQQNIGLAPPPPQQTDLPKGSNVNTPVPNITPPSATFQNVPVTNAPPQPPSSTESCFQNVPITSTTDTFSNLSINPQQNLPNPPNLQQGSFDRQPFAQQKWEQNPLTQPNPVIEENLNK